jgi:hypothetical protein
MLAILKAWPNGRAVGEGRQDIHLSDEQRIDWLRLIRSQNVGPRGLRAHLQLSRRRPQSMPRAICFPAIVAR